MADDQSMTRRRFLEAAGAAGITALAGCSDSSDQSTPTDGSTPTGTPPGTETGQNTDNTDEQQTTEDPETAVRYFFQDETGALGHLADNQVPENYNHVITNTKTEQEYDEMQRNDREYPEGLEQGELDMTVDEMINRAETIYNNPAQEFEGPVEAYGIDFSEEDDEITFVRSLIKAADEAGVDSSGLADIVVNNIAEDAVDQIQPGFNNFKLSTLHATEPINPNSTGAGGGAERSNQFGTYVNSGFSHLPGILQYEKDGETEVKYAEVTDPLNMSFFRRVIREPEFSVYRSSLDQDTVAVSRDSEPGDSGSAFPEHYVTALDYTKARELESQDILGLGENSVGGINAVGDHIGVVLYELVDDMGITGYNINEDRDLTDRVNEAALDGTLVSDEFGESLEDYVINPTTEKRQYMENIARGMYQIQQQEGWGTSLALTGTLENPEILPTNQETVNQVRQDQAYDQVRERVTGQA